MIPHLSFRNAERLDACPAIDGLVFLLNYQLDSIHEQQRRKLTYEVKPPRTGSNLTGGMSNASTTAK